MPLDLFQTSKDEAASEAQSNLAPRLPSGFGENYAAQRDAGQLFSNSLSEVTARSRVMEDYIGEVNATGASVDHLRDLSSGAPDLDAINAEVMKRKAADPTLQLMPLTDEDLASRAEGKSRGARMRAAALGAGEQTTGGKIGGFLGSAESSLEDPVNIVALPIAPAAGLGVLMTGVAMGAIAITSQGAIEILGARYHQKVEPDYLKSGEYLTNILEAGAGGAVLGGGLKVAGKLFRHYFPAKEAPQPLRDPVNVANSELQIAKSNVYPGIAGEVANRDAMVKTLDDALANRPIDVSDHITPEIIKSYEARLGPVMDTRAKAVGAAQWSSVLEQDAAKVSPEIRAAADTNFAELRQAAGPLKAEGPTEALRRSLVRYAQEGYGVNLSRVDARATAEALAGATDQEAADMVEAINRELTSRKAANNKASGVPNVNARVKAVESQGHMANLAEHVQDLARSAGRIMGKDEATVIASRIARVSETEALRTLDELLLRPRTLVETLPGWNGERTFTGHFDSEDAALFDRGDAFHYQDVTPLAGSDLGHAAEHGGTIGGAPEGMVSMPPLGDYRPGVIATGARAEFVRASWAAMSPIHSLEHVIERSAANQGRLVEIGDQIAKAVGATFKNPGAKSAGRLTEKIARGKAPDTITDAVRGGFELKAPADAEAIVKELGKYFELVDEGWVVTHTNYFDRKVIVRFKDGQLGEVQLWQPDMVRAKSKGGHKLYTAWQKMEPGSAPWTKALGEQRALYGSVLDGLAPEWKALAGSGGTSGNASANAAGDSGLAFSAKNAPLPGGSIQAPLSLENTHASPVVSERYAGVPSQDSGDGGGLSGTTLPIPTHLTLSSVKANGPLLGPRVPGIPAHRVATAHGPVDVQPIVVEAKTLTTSDNKAFPEGMQPRDRDRAAAQQQVREIATELNPERLGMSSEADRGSPIVGPDGTVESGNGRVMGIRQAYETGGPLADGYRAWITAQGIDASGFKEPVLVRQRLTEMTQPQREQFARDANAPSTLTMSAPERAAADAQMLDADAISLIRNGHDLGAAANRDFHKTFVSKLPRTEHGAMMTPSGHLSAEGLLRIRNAVLARAYGDTAVLTRIAESTHDEVKSISHALVAASPEWAKLRMAVEEGRVRPDIDITADLLDAVNRTAHIRDTGMKLPMYLAQVDAFNPLPPNVEPIMNLFYAGKNGRATGGPKIAEALDRYAVEGQKVGTQAGLDLMTDPVTVADLLKAAWRRAGGAAPDEPNLLARLQPTRDPAPGAVQSLAENTTAAKAKEMRDNPDTGEAVVNNLDRLRSTKDVEVPVGVTTDEHGKKVAVMRSADAMMAEAEAREAAAAEIELCAKPAKDTAA